MTLDLSIDIQKNDDITTVSFKGEMDDFHADAVNDALTQLIETEKEKKLILNLEHTSFIDSIGLGCIASAGKKLAAENGKAQIVCNREQVLKLLESSGMISALENHLGVSDSIETAKQELSYNTYR